MVDDKFPRPTRDSYARPATSAQSNNDPLAELARLIGNNDPFAGYGNDGTPRAARAPTNEQSPDWGQPHGHAADAASPDPRMTQMASGYSDDNYAAHGQNYGAHNYEQAGGQQYAQADGAYDRQDAGYYADNTRVHPDEDMYDAPPARSRTLMMAGAAAAALLLMVGGVFAYRSMFGGSRSASPPPVIKAETAPSKVTPPPQAQTDPISGKLIQDRVGGSQNERVVSREEQPIDMRDRPPPARVIFPGPGASGNIAGGSADSRQAAASIPAPNSTEPKKIRTIAIKPDQLGSAAAESAPAPATPSRAATSPPVRPAAPAADNTATTPATSRPTPSRQQTAAAATAQSGGGPLSLTPDATAAASPPARTASLPPAPRAPASSSGGVGSYVQVSSQRSEADAQSSFSALQAKYPNVLGGRPVAIRRADLGDKGTYYRAMVGPLGSEQATELCTSLKAAGGSCIVQRN